MALVDSLMPFPFPFGYPSKEGAGLLFGFGGGPVNLHSGMDETKAGELYEGWICTLSLMSLEGKKLYAELVVTPPPFRRPPWPISGTLFRTLWGGLLFGQ